MIAISIVIIALFVYWILDPHIDLDKKNQQLIIWYGTWDNRMKFMIPWKSKE